MRALFRFPVAPLRLMLPVPLLPQAEWIEAVRPVDRKRYAKEEEAETFDNRYIRYKRNRYLLSRALM